MFLILACMSLRSFIESKLPISSRTSPTLETPQVDVALAKYLSFQRFKTSRSQVQSVRSLLPFTAHAVFLSYSRFDGIRTLAPHFRVTFYATTGQGFRRISRASMLPPCKGEQRNVGKVGRSTTSLTYWPRQTLLSSATGSILLDTCRLNPKP